MPKKVIFFPEKRMEGILMIFVYVLEYLLTLVCLDKMQNISTLLRKNSKSEGRAFESYSNETGLSSPVNYSY